MTTRADVAPSSASVAIWVLAVQCLLALSWTLYVLFLPGLLAAAGIERRWFVYVLIADQLIFAACDWAAGVCVDRLDAGPTATTWKRTGRGIAAITLVSSAFLLAMPWVAERGHPVLLLAIVFVWAATSSALRAPVFALLGRVRETATNCDGEATDRHAFTARPGAVSAALVGIGLAGAIGPFVTMLLKGVDSRLPLAASAVSLALAGSWATRIDERLPAAPTAVALDAMTAPSKRAWSLAITVLIAAFGTQIVTGVIALPLFQRFVGTDAILWTGWFWIGFAAGLVPGNRIAASGMTVGTWRRAAGALVVASFAFGLGSRIASLAAVTTGVAVTGAAWGVFTTIAFASAVSLSGGRATAGGAGTASGMLFSALAVATLLRLVLVVNGATHADIVAWLPQIAWVIASILLVVLAGALLRAR